MNPTLHTGIYLQRHLHGELVVCFSRYTGHLAAKARSVMAIDFMEAFIEKNREVNNHYGNVVFKQADVTKLELPQERYKSPTGYLCLTEQCQLLDRKMSEIKTGLISVINHLI